MTCYWQQADRCEGHDHPEIEERGNHPCGQVKKWLYLRLVYIGFFASGGLPFGRAGIHSNLPVFIPVVPFFLFVCLTVSHLRQAIRRHPGEQDWSRPTWFTSPFGGSTHGFHVAGFSLMTLGATAGISALYHHADVVLPLFFFAAGFGVYCGLLIFYRLFYNQPPMA